MPKVSELVRGLQDLIGKYGDCEVVVTREDVKMMHFIEASGVLLAQDKDSIDMFTLQAK